MSSTAPKRSVRRPARSKTSASPVRIVSLDGGGVTTLISLLLLKRLEEARPGFLAGIDMFVGSGFGGVNALLLAATKTPQDMLETCISLWDGRTNIWQTSTMRALRMLQGTTSIYDSEALHEHLSALLEDRTLTDLEKDVGIVAFDVAGRDTGTWSPVFFTNWGPGHFHGETQSAVAAGMAAAAIPATFPIAGGYIDLSLIAKNPSLMTVNELLTKARGARPVQLGPSIQSRLESSVDSTTEAMEGPVSAEMLGQVRLLSFGSGRHPHRVDQLDVDWGWRPWLGDLKDPGLVFRLIEDAGLQNTDLACINLLGRGGYHRLDPILPQRIPMSHDHGGAGSRRIIGETVRLSMEAAEATDLRETLAWLDGSDRR